MDAVDRSPHRADFDSSALTLDLPCVLVCGGKSCRKAKGYDELLADMGGLAEVKKVKCVDVCEGPVVGVKVNGKTVWFERMRSDKVRAAVVALLHKRKVPKKLRPHKV
jgi:(2Fe-2S) ferredoxin